MSPQLKTVTISVTGAPNSGKSTTIKKLRQRGFPVIDEQAGAIIAEGKLSPKIDFDAFNAEVLRRIQAREKESIGDIVFVDRGVYDALAYYEILQRPLPSFLKVLEPNRYHLAFILDVVPQWEDNGIRVEDIEFARAIDPLFASVYAKMRVNTIRVPLMKPEERVAFILKTTKGMFPDVNLNRLRADGSKRTISQRKLALHSIVEEIEYSMALLSGIRPAVCIYGATHCDHNSRQYRSARKLGRLMAVNDIAVITGGGMGIGAAANRGSKEKGGASIAVNVAYPHGDGPNAFTSVPIRVGSIACRNEVFRLCSDAYVVYPGGLGTLSDVEESVRLIQTACMERVPIVLVGTRFWNGYKSFLKSGLSAGYVTNDDLSIMQIVPSEQQALDIVTAHIKGKVG